MKKLLLVVFGFSSFFAVAQTGYDITIHLKNCPDTLAYLTYYQFDKTLIKDTCTSIKDGKIVFTGKKKLEKGIYSLVSQKKTIYFDFFVDDNTQKLELKTEASPNISKELTAVNSPAENEFFRYVEFINGQNNEFMAFKDKNKFLNKKDSLALTKKQNDIEKTIRNYEEQFLARHKGSYIGDVINLKIEKTLSEIPKASNGRPDSIKAYNYYRKHYWDDVNFADEGTMRNPFSMLS
ncbi:MAG: DUF4369 domain-containing protein [Flavobacterium sp.]